MCEAYTGKHAGRRGVAVPKGNLGPVRSVDAGDEGVNVPEVRTVWIAMVRSERPVGARSRGMYETEASLNSGEPIGSRRGMGVQLTGGCTDD